MKMKIIFGLLVCASTTVFVLSANAESIYTKHKVCPYDKPNCSFSEKVCAPGYMIPLGCGGCDSMQSRGVVCKPDFSQCPCE